MARYSYKAQPEICKWNLIKLAEAMADVLPLAKSRALLEDVYVYYFDVNSFMPEDYDLVFWEERKQLAFSRQYITKKKQPCSYKLWYDITKRSQNL